MIGEVLCKILEYKIAAAKEYCINYNNISEKMNRPDNFGIKSWHEILAV